ncbi:MAG: hypothetical protein GF355_12840 [Candidatus Eisenbacteria bacterium]|nr:hypothetical protein [Candidatus Eisenbacteria bacterium]
MNPPVDHMVFDLFLHEDLERRIRPGIEAHLHRMPLEAHPGDRCLTRLPGSLKLGLLRRGLDHAGCNVYPRQSALMNHVLEKIGWPANECIGFRCKVEYPVWRAGYHIPFEYVELS